MKKLFWACVLASFSLSQSAFADIPQTITFATEATYPPFEYIDAAGHIQGYDIDLANALCKEMKVQCTFSNQPWDSLIPSLKLGKFNALIGALGITDARKQQVDFTDPYLAATASFVAPIASHLSISPEGLKGKIIGVQGGTTYEQYLATEYGDSIKIKTYTSIQDALLDLTSGRVDAIIGDTPSITDWLNKHNTEKKYGLVGEAINNPKMFGIGYAIAVKKGNTELVNAFNAALTKIKQEGIYQKLNDTYFPEH